MGQRIPGLQTGEFLDFQVLEKFAGGYLLRFRGNNFFAETLMDLNPGAHVTARVLASREHTLLETLSIREFSPSLPDGRIAGSLPDVISQDLPPPLRITSFPTDLSDGLLEPVRSPLQPAGKSQNGQGVLWSDVARELSDPAPLRTLQARPPVAASVSEVREPEPPFALLSRHSIHGPFARVPLISGPGLQNSEGAAIPSEISYAEVIPLGAEPLKLMPNEYLQAKVIAVANHATRLEIKGHPFLIPLSLDLPIGEEILFRVHREPGSAPLTLEPYSPLQLRTLEEKSTSLMATIRMADSLPVNPQIRPGNRDAVPPQDGSLTSPSNSPLPIPPPRTQGNSLMGRLWEFRSEATQPHEPAVSSFVPPSQEVFARLRPLQAVPSPDPLRSEAREAPVPFRSLEVYCLSGRQPILSQGEPVTAKVVGLTSETTILELKGARLLIGTPLPLEAGDFISLLSTYQDGDLYLEPLESLSVFKRPPGLAVESHERSGVPMPAVPAVPRHPPVVGMRADGIPMEADGLMPAPIQTAEPFHAPPATTMISSEGLSFRKADDLAPAVSPAVLTAERSGPVARSDELRSFRVISEPPADLKPDIDYRAKVLDIQSGVSFLQLENRLIVVETTDFPKEQELRARLASAQNPALLRLEPSGAGKDFPPGLQNIRSIPSLAMPDAMDYLQEEGRSASEPPVAVQGKIASATAEQVSRQQPGLPASEALPAALLSQGVFSARIIYAPFAEGPEKALAASSASPNSVLSSDIRLPEGLPQPGANGEPFLAKVIRQTAEGTVLDFQGTRAMVQPPMNYPAGTILSLSVSYKDNELLLELAGLPSTIPEITNSAAAESGPAVPGWTVPEGGTMPVSASRISLPDIQRNMPLVLLGRVNLQYLAEADPAGGRNATPVFYSSEAFSLGPIFPSLSAGQELNATVRDVLPSGAVLSLRGASMQLQVPAGVEPGTQLRIRVLQPFPRASWEIEKALPSSKENGLSDENASALQALEAETGGLIPSAGPAVRTGRPDILAERERILTSPFSNISALVSKPGFIDKAGASGWTLVRVVGGIPDRLPPDKEMTAKVTEVQSGIAFLSVEDQRLAIEYPGLKAGQGVKVQRMPDTPSPLLRLTMESPTDFQPPRSQNFVVSQSMAEETSLLNPGQSIAATVYRKVQTGRYLLEYKGTFHEVQSTETLRPGSEVELRLESQSGKNSIFRLVRQSMSMEQLAELVLKEKLPSLPPPAQSFSELRAEVNLAARTLLHDIPIGRQLQNLENLLARFMPAEGLPKGEHLSNFVRNGGMQFEARLAQSLHQPDDLKAVIESDLKGQLLTALQTIQQSAAQPSLQKLNSSIQQYLNLIESQQLNNSLSLSQGNAFHLDIPFYQGAQPHLLHLTVQPDPQGGKEQGSKSSGSRGHKVLFLLELDHFGQTRIDSYISARSVDAILYIENREAIQHLRPRLGAFQRRLQDLGYPNAHLEVRPLLAGSPEKRIHRPVIAEAASPEQAAVGHSFKTKA